MTKPNLVILHSFPTNSILLQGLKEYLSDFFQVYIIDLPGFTKASRPLETISIENYANYVDSAIESLHLDTYILCGISFGFILLLTMKLNSGCKGILAIEPYLGRDTLNSKKQWRYTLVPFINVVDKLHLINAIWKSAVFKRLFSGYFLSDLPPSIPETILKEVDGKTFVQTLKLILTTKPNYNLRTDIPHVLMINKEDSTINAGHIQDIFRKRLKKVMVIESTMPHFPTDLSESFFRQTFQRQEIDNAISFLYNNA